VQRGLRAQQVPTFPSSFMQSPPVAGVGSHLCLSGTKHQVNGAAVLQPDSLLREPPAVPARASAAPLSAETLGLASAAGCSTSSMAPATAHSFQAGRHRCAHSSGSGAQRRRPSSSPPRRCGRSARRRPRTRLSSPARRHPQRLRCSRPGRQPQCRTNGGTSGCGIESSGPW
jgi:hypothetical protein